MTLISSPSSDPRGCTFPKDSPRVKLDHQPSFTVIAFVVITDLISHLAVTPCKQTFWKFRDVLCNGCLFYTRKIWVRDFAAQIIKWLVLKELNLVKASLNSGSFSLVVLFYSLVGIVNYVKGILNPVQCVKKSNMSGRFKGGQRC